MWDLRGGRSSAAFQNHKEVVHSLFSFLLEVCSFNMVEKLVQLSNHEVLHDYIPSIVSGIQIGELTLVSCGISSSFFFCLFIF